jgi:hypothetical protein
VAKSASALERAFLAILVLELEAMVVRLFRPRKVAGVHGDCWTVRLAWVAPADTLMLRCASKSSKSEAIFWRFSQNLDHKVIHAILKGTLARV